MSFMKLMADLGLDVGPFQTGLKKADQAAISAGKSIGNTLKGAFGAYFGYQAFQKVVGDTWRNMAQIKDLSDQFSITTDEVQKLTAASENVGMKFEDMGAGLLKMNAARADAVKGNAELEDSFARFGISLDELRNPAVQNADLMKRIGTALAGIKPRVEDLDALKDLFGRSGARMVAALREIQNINEPIISQDDIDKVDEMEEAMKRLNREFKRTIAPAVADVSNGITEALRDKKTFFSDYLKTLADPFGIFFKSDTSAKVDTSPLPIPPKRDEVPAPNAAERRRDAENSRTLREERENFEKKMLDFSIRQMSKKEKLAAYQKESAQIGLDINDVENAANMGLVDRTEAEIRILELKQSQLDVLQKIKSEEQKGNADFTGLGKVLGVGAESAALRSVSTTRPALPANFNQPFPNAGKVMNEQLGELKKIVAKLGKTITFAN